MFRNHFSVFAPLVCSLTFSCGRSSHGEDRSPAKLQDVSLDNGTDSPIFWSEGEKIFSSFCPKSVAPSRKNCATGAYSTGLAEIRKSVENAFAASIKKTDDDIAKEINALKANDSVLPSMSKRLDFLTKRQQLLKTEIDRINEILKIQRTDLIKLENLIADETTQLAAVDAGLEKDPQNMDLKNLQPFLKASLAEHKTQKATLSNEIVTNQDDAYQLKEQLDDVNKDIAETKKERDQYAANISSPALRRLNEFKQSEVNATKVIANVFDLMTASEVYASKKLTVDENRVVIQIANLISRPLKEGLFKTTAKFGYDLKMKFAIQNDSMTYSAEYFHAGSSKPADYTHVFTNRDGIFLGPSGSDMQVVNQETFKFISYGTVAGTFTLFR